MISASQIRDVAARHLSQNDAEQFIREFSALSHNIHKNGDAEAIALANQIELKRADLQAKLISPVEFADFLRAMVNPFVMNAPISVLISGPVNYPVAASAYQAWVAVFGTSRVVEYESERHPVQEQR